jgi:hypothetical protein
MSSDSALTRTLRHEPSLAQLRKQAKELLKSYRPWGRTEFQVYWAEVDRSNCFSGRLHSSRFTVAIANQALK